LKLLLPVLIPVMIVAAIPIVMAFARALLTDDGHFAGLANFSGVLTNPELFNSIRATLIYAAIVVPTEVLVGLGLAALVHRTVRSNGLRALIYILASIPIVIPMIAVGVVFRLIYVADYGLLNVLLGGVGKGQIFWLSDPTLAMVSVATVDVWQWTPFVYLVMFAGFQTVHHEAVEAAEVDGAGAWARFRFIELPYLRPLLVLVVFFRLADVMWVFDHVYVLTGGGPGTTTQFLSLFLYKVAFRFDRLGPASALAAVIMVVMTAVYIIINRYLPKESS
jgi:multiple sugar transport system permease protein